MRSPAIYIARESLGGSLLKKWHVLYVYVRTYTYMRNFINIYNILGFFFTFKENIFSNLKIHRVCTYVMLMYYELCILIYLYSWKTMIKPIGNMCLFLCYRMFKMYICASMTSHFTVRI